MRLKPKTPMDYYNAEQPDAVLADLEAKHGSSPTSGSATAIDLNRYEQARAERQRWTLAQSVEAQEERIAEHYTAFAHLAMQLRELTEARKHGCTTDLNDTIRYLTGKIREGHLMEFGIQLEWPNDRGELPRPVSGGGSQKGLSNEK